jgi:hypothetical protein
MPRSESNILRNQVISNPPIEGIGFIRVGDVDGTQIQRRPCGAISRIHAVLLSPTAEQIERVLVWTPGCGSRWIKSTTLTRDWRRVG